MKQTNKQNYLSLSKSAESFEACCQWALLSALVTTLLFTFSVQKYIYPSVWKRILKCMWMDLVPERGGGANLSTWRNPLTTGLKISMTYQRWKFTTPRQGSNPRSLTLVLGENVPALTHWITGCRMAGDSVSRSGWRNGVFIHLMVIHLFILLKKVFHIFKNIHYIYFLHFTNHFREIQATLPGSGYSESKSSTTRSYKCMLGLFVFP